VDVQKSKRKDRFNIGFINKQGLGFEKADQDFFTSKKMVNGKLTEIKIRIEIPDNKMWL
jgi:hypothetical protein